MANGADRIRVIENPYAFEPVLNPKYLVLGYLNEYMGRDTGSAQDVAAGITVTSPSPAERAQVVERFFPAETHLVEAFSQALRAWASNEGLELSLNVERGQQGHAFVRGKAANQLINQCYSDSERIGWLGSAAVHEGMFPAHPGVWTPSSDWVDARFSYLLGCHRRFGNGTELKFSNAPHKADLVIEFLEQIGCPRIQREWTTQGAPRVTWIRFEPTDALVRWLDIDEA